MCPVTVFVIPGCNRDHLRFQHDAVWHLFAVDALEL